LHGDLIDRSGGFQRKNQLAGKNLVSREPHTDNHLSAIELSGFQEIADRRRRIDIPSNVGRRQGPTAIT
jgi:hypothetical protein